MRKIKDLVGLKFDHLSVLKFIGLEGKVAYWECKCDCGETCIRGRDYLSRKFYKSCGCMHRTGEKMNKDCSSYRIWAGMKSRCDSNDVNTKQYKNYVLKGITYCEEWELFSNFYNDMGRDPKGHLLTE